MRVEKNFELLKNISSVGIILRPESPELKDVYQNIKDLLVSINCIKVDCKDLDSCLCMELSKIHQWFSKWHILNWKYAEPFPKICMLSSCNKR